MIMAPRKLFLAFIALLLLQLLLTGCSGTVKHMETVAISDVINEPEYGKSIIVFLRPSRNGHSVQSSVFEIEEDKPSLVGIVAAKKKVAYQLDPGEHLFMVIGENAGFMSATLEANRTYYAIIIPRMGWWKARFSLKPVVQDRLKSDQFNNWLLACEWVKKTSDSELWANQNMPSIRSKYDKYYTDWMNKSWADRPKLQMQDGKRSSVFMVKPSRADDIDLKNYYSPQDAVDNFDDGENEYFSPQDPKPLDRDGTTN